jgi:hypothetical protein
LDKRACEVRDPRISTTALRYTGLYLRVEMPHARPVAFFTRHVSHEPRALTKLVASRGEGAVCRSNRACSARAQLVLTTNQISYRPRPARSSKRPRAPGARTPRLPGAIWDQLGGDGSERKPMALRHLPRSKRAKAQHVQMKRGAAYARSQAAGQSEKPGNARQSTAATYQKSPSRQADTVHSTRKRERSSISSPRSARDSPRAKRGAAI